MIDRTLGAAIIAAAVFCALIAFELASVGPGSVVATDRQAAMTPAAAGPVSPTAASQAELLLTLLGSPLFSPARRPQPQSQAGEPTGLVGIRLSGMVIEPDRRIAIFAAPGAKPVIRTEGELLGNWRIETISAQNVSLSGPTGSQILEPKPDPGATRSSPPPTPAFRPRTANPVPPPATVRARGPTSPSLPPTPPVASAGLSKAAVPDDLPKSP